MKVHSKWSFISIQHFHSFSFGQTAPASPSRQPPLHGPRLHGASLPGLQHYLPPSWCTSNRWWLPRPPIFYGKMGDVAKKGWTNMAKLNKNGTFNFSFGGVVWKKLNYNMEKHNSEPVVSTSPQKGTYLELHNSLMDWWKVGFRSWKW